MNNYFIQATLNIARALAPPQMVAQPEGRAIESKRKKHKTSSGRLTDPAYAQLVLSILTSRNHVIEIEDALDLLWRNQIDPDQVNLGSPFTRAP